MIDESVYLADGARIVGNVSIGEHSSVWYNAVVRGDRSRITIGRCTNVQDCCVIHSPERFPVRIGDFVTVGHGAKLHGAEIGDNTLVGMGAILMNGTKVEGDSIIAAATVLTENTIVPRGSLVVGIPGKIVRKLSSEEIESIKQNALEYRTMASTAKARKKR